MQIEYIFIILGVVVILGLCMCLAIANFGYERFYDKLLELSKVKIADSTLGTLEYVKLINDTLFNSRLQIHFIQGMTGDAYAKGNIFLSENTVNSNSLASFAVISHELGHALQDKEGRKLKRLIALTKIIRVFGILFWPLLIAGAVLFFIGGYLRVIGYILLAAAGISIILAFLLKLINISIEKDASKKALVLLKEVLNDKEMKQAKKLLNYAKMTYWALFLRSLFGWTLLTRKGKLFDK